MIFFPNLRFISVKQSSGNILVLMILLSILGFGCWLRYAYVTQTVVDNPLQADAEQYVRYGVNLLVHGVHSSSAVAGKVRPDSFRPPGYPALIALACKLGGPHFFYPLLLKFQVVLSTLSILLVYCLARQWLPRGAGLLAALLAALNPHAIAFSGYVLTETLFGWLLLAAVCSFLQGVRLGKPGWLFVSGIAFGCAYLTNETALFLPFVLTAYVLWRRKNKSNTLKKGFILLLLVFMLFPSAWILRNTFLLPDDAPRSGRRAVETMSHGAYPDFTYLDPARKYYPQFEDPEQPAFGSSLAAFTHILWKRVREHPGRYLRWYLLEKTCHAWNWGIYQGQGDVFVYMVRTSLFHESWIAFEVHELMRWSYPLLFIFTVSGVVLLFIRPSAPLVAPEILYILLGYYTLLFVVFVPWPRYSVPLRPLLYPLTIWAVFECWLSGIRYVQKKKQRSCQPSVG